MAPKLRSEHPPSYHIYDSVGQGSGQGSAKWLFSACGISSGHLSKIELSDVQSNFTLVGCQATQKPGQAGGKAARESK